MKLLLIDDEIVALNALNKRIDWVKYGFSEVLTAQSAKQARDILAEKKIELALCDIEMPGEDGLSLAKFIHETYPMTTCIMVTCHADFGYLKDAMRSRVYDYILKPIDYEELDQLILKFLEDREENAKKSQISVLVEKTESVRGEEIGQADRVTIVKRYIEEHLQEKIYIEDLANLIHINEQYFMRIFKKETGKSVTEYITDRRIAVASTLLRDTDKSINFIADCVGCENYSYFTKLFKKYTGFTPREYRAQFQK